MNNLDPNPQVGLFFQRLDRLDAGGRARLKRSAGQPLAAARREALGLFYSLLPPGVPEWQHETYFLAATLYPLADGGGSGDLGATLRRARSSRNAKGIDRRVMALLDADESQLAYRLRRAIFFLQSNRVRIHWQALLQDLLAWNAPSRYVQRRWAQSYFQADPTPAANRS
jgi:CRISPR system Cascade subunit CasB